MTAEAVREEQGGIYNENVPNNHLPACKKNCRFLVLGLRDSELGGLEWDSGICIKHIPDFQADGP